MATGIKAFSINIVNASYKIIHYTCPPGRAAKCVATLLVSASSNSGATQTIEFGSIPCSASQGAVFAAIAEPITVYLAAGDVISSYGELGHGSTSFVKAQIAIIEEDVL